MQEPADVLLVDDDPDWVRLTARLVERADSLLRVHTATTVDDALEVLDETDVDCVVSDYDMPGMDGLALLETVRERRPDIPFVLVTGKGSEAVASEAISAHVTDYLVKRPNVDQSGLLANRVANAVERRRIERALAESEQRYRSLVEQSRDAICIYREGGLAFVNESACRLSGYEESTLLDLDPVADLVLPADRDRVSEALARHLDGGDGDPPSTCEARISVRDGGTRHCEIRAGHVTYDDRPAVLASVRDVTERKRRERTIRRERDAKETIRDILVNVSTREGVETACCERLVEDGYAFAWVGEHPADREVVPRTSAGDGDGYLAAVDLATDDGAAEPAVAAVRERALQVVDDVAAVGEPWAEAAVAGGFRTAAAVPLVDRDVLYGVLAVFADRPGAIDDAERDVLWELGEALAHAIGAAERERALLADGVVEVGLHVRDPGYPLVALARQRAFTEANASLAVEGIVPRSEDTVLLFVTVAGLSAVHLAGLAVERAGVVEATPLDDDGDGGERLTLVLRRPTAGSVLADRGAVVRSVSVENRSARLVAELPLRKNVHDVVEGFYEQFPDSTVESYHEYERPPGAGGDADRSLPDSLTGRQAAALETAYHGGYFERPKDQTADELAESLDITRSTFLQHLRVAQRKVYAELLD